LKALDQPLSLVDPFSGNAMSMAAGNAFMDYVMVNPQIYPELVACRDRLQERFRSHA
jgi:glutamate-1-semialdehyde aminotransferase